MCVRVSACELTEVCACISAAGDPCEARTSDCVHVHVSEGTSGFRQSESLSFSRSNSEEQDSREVEETVEGGSGEEHESPAGLGLVRGDVAEVDMEEDVDTVGDGEEVENGLGAAKEECKELTAEGDKEEKDLEMGDLGAEEVGLILEDIILLSE